MEDIHDNHAEVIVHILDSDIKGGTDRENIARFPLRQLTNDVGEEYKDMAGPVLALVEGGEMVRPRVKAQLLVKIIAKITDFSVDPAHSLTRQVISGVSLSFGLLKKSQL
jgi:hypothetical protein